MSSQRLLIPAGVIVVTRDHLRTTGRLGIEGVVLWAGRRDDTKRVTRAIVPEQQGDPGRFTVPLTERQRLSRDLAREHELILCQVHSHPGRAFHSWLDDAEALPRHIGAFSLVVPDFAARDELFDGAALFELTSDGRWTETTVTRLSVAKHNPLTRLWQWLRAQPSTSERSAT